MSKVSDKLTVAVKVSPFLLYSPLHAPTNTYTHIHSTHLKGPSCQVALSACVLGVSTFITPVLYKYKHVSKNKNIIKTFNIFCQSFQKAKLLFY